MNEPLNGHVLLDLVAGMVHTPLAMEERAAIALAVAVASRHGIDVAAEGIDAAIAAASEPLAFSGRSQAQAQMPYTVDAGMATIPVTGGLVPDAGYWEGRGLTGYNRLGERVIAAYNDPRVEAIFMPIHSYGGQVMRCMDTTDLIRSVNLRNGGKPIFAVSAEAAYSAAYSIASAADHIYVPRTGGVGSVGVLMVHAEFSRLYEKAGISVRVFRSDERKARGNSMEPMDDETADEIQAEIEEMRDVFVETVAAGRKGLSAKKIREAKGGTFMGKRAVEAGFADTVASVEQAYVDAHIRMRRKRSKAA